jgi:hypothetical protein
MQVLQINMIQVLQIDMILSDRHEISVNSI